MSREYKLYLEDILDCIEKIEKYTASLNFVEFSSNSLVQDAVVRNLEIIGEAVKNIPMEIKKLKEDINWRQIAGLRDIMIHAYFTLDLDIIWEIKQDKIPELKIKIKELLDQF
ncbi:hypothetical protein ES705_48583 [subsurface metagenome]|jgi:uncharacterized protein with HEPN domain